MELRRWIQRARNRPLTIKIQQSKQAAIGIKESILIKELLAYSNQWKSIDMFCPGLKSADVYANMIDIMKQPPLSLEAFTCRPSPHCQCLMDGHPEFRIRATPNLTQVAQFGFPISISLSGLKVCKWIDILMDAITLIDKLKDMVNIVDFTYNNSTHCYVYQYLNSRLPSQPQLLQLPYLKSFTLHGFARMVDIEYILGSLTLPALQQFTFYNSTDYNVGLGYDHQTSIFKHILSMLQRSNPPCVQFLDIGVNHACYFEPEELLNILRVVPTLKHFKYYLNLIESYTVPDIRNHPVLFDFVTLNSLTTFYINLGSLRSAGNFSVLHHLILPVLEEFQVELPCERTPQYFLADLAALVKRSRCPLKTLKINTVVNISKASLVNLFKSTPTLEYLHIRGPLGLKRYGPKSKEFYIKDGLFDILRRCRCGNCKFASPEDKKCKKCLGNLSKLFLEGTLRADWNGMLSALEYRSKGDVDDGIQKLSQVRICASGCDIANVKDQVQQRIQSLQHRGMEFMDKII
ncbi:hypothetical protein BDQ17DRAFT_1431994 [Cyathus striatus]|nr:hypothetical protein BDQ17DRAFT_1431994 [Cyathus striatus]